jgi:phage terminase large subunit
MDQGAYGGRGSGKSHFFAGLLIEDALKEPGESQEGLRAVCIREVQKDLAQSSKALIERKLSDFRLGEADGFKVFKDEIRTPKDGLFIFKGMQDYTADSIKSLEGFKRAWVEEAQTLTSLSLQMLRPTIRATGSELWFSWNPRRKTDPVDMMLRGDELPSGARVVRANWSDNPWLPAELETEREDCIRLQPDQYDHIWEGGYAAVTVGAYFARQLSEMKAQGRLGRAARERSRPTTTPRRMAHSRSRTELTAEHSRPGRTPLESRSSREPRMRWASDGRSTTPPTAPRRSGCTWSSRPKPMARSYAE